MIPLLDSQSTTEPKQEIESDVMIEMCPVFCMLTLLQILEILKIWSTPDFHFSKVK